MSETYFGSQESPQEEIEKKIKEWKEVLEELGLKVKKSFLFDSEKRKYIHDLGNLMSTIDLFDPSILESPEEINGYIERISKDVLKLKNTIESEINRYSVI